MSFGEDRVCGVAQKRGSFSSTSRTGSLDTFKARPVRTCASTNVRQEQKRTNDVCEALAAVLAALEAEEALDGAKEAVLRAVNSLEAVRVFRKTIYAPCQHLLHAAWKPSGVRTVESSCE